MDYLSTDDDRISGVHRVGSAIDFNGHTHEKKTYLKRGPAGCPVLLAAGGEQ